MSQKLIKNVKTVAEKAGLPSAKEKAAEIEAVKAQVEPKPERKSRKVAETTDGMMRALMDKITALEGSIKPKAERKKRVLSDEQKNVLRERLVKAREVRASKSKKE